MEMFDYGALPSMDELADPSGDQASRPSLDLRREEEVQTPGNSIRDHEPDDVEQTPSWTWRCLGCDSSECCWTASGWKCSGCNGSDFYKTNGPAKKVNPQGTWVFPPFPGDHPSDPGECPCAVPGEQSRTAPRRRRRRKFPGDPDDLTGGRERGESETPTVDPEVDPDLPVPPRVPGRALRDPQLPRQGHQRALLPDRASGVAASSNDDRLLHALKSLVNKKNNDDDWHSMAGPQRGVRWRGGAAPLPPTWRYDRDDLRAYSKFVKKVEIWKLQVAPYMSKREMALAPLYNSLQGEAEQELEHTPIEEIFVDDGVDKIVEALRANGAEGGVPEEEILE